MYYWNWSGKYLGIRLQNNFFSAKGNPIGRFDDDNMLYDFNGKYIGEIKSENRIIINKAKTHLLSYVFPKPVKIPQTSLANLESLAMLAGYSDFVWKD